MKAAGKILLIDTIHPLFVKELEDMGFTITDGTKLSEKEVLDSIDQYDGIEIRSRIKVDKSFLDKAVRLKFIARAGAGMESIDETYALQKGVQCLSAPEGNRDAVGEHVLSMILNLFNNINRADREVRSGKWNREVNRGEELMGKTFGIIGYGNMGSSVARRLAGFECEVIAYDKYKSPSFDPFAKRVDLAELQERSDIVSLHVPLTEETLGMINAAFIKDCKKPFYLINTARGKTVRTPDLVDGLQSGKIKGACLDVIEYESHSFENFSQHEVPAAYRYLLESEKVVLTPHIAGWTHQSLQKIAKVLVEKIKKINS